MQRPARPLGPPLGVERGGDRVRVRVDLLHAAQRGPAAVDRLDPLQVDVDQRLRGEAAGLHRLLQRDDGRLLDGGVAAAGADGGAGAEQRRQRQAPDGESAPAKELSARGHGLSLRTR